MGQHTTAQAAQDMLCTFGDTQNSPCAYWLAPSVPLCLLGKGWSQQQPHCSLSELSKKLNRCSGVLLIKLNKLGTGTWDQWVTHSKARSSLCVSFAVCTAPLSPALQHWSHMRPSLKCVNSFCRFPFCKTSIASRFFSS